MLEPFNITPLCDDPERAHTVGAVYWEARPLGSSDGGLIKCIVGEDWIVQRIPSGELKIALYINSYHRSLPELRANRPDVSAPIEISVMGH